MVSLAFGLAADLYITGEQALTETYGQDIASDVVKMNHHGKDTSNGKDFVQAMSPKIAVGCSTAWPAGQWQCGI